MDYLDEETKNIIKFLLICIVIFLIILDIYWTFTGTVSSYSPAPYSGLGIELISF